MKEGRKGCQKKRQSKTIKLARNYTNLYNLLLLISLINIRGNENISLKKRYLVTRNSVILTVNNV